MSNDSANNGSPNDRRGSVTTAAFSNLFHRSNSTSAGTGGGRESAASAAARDQRRRLSITTLGLSGASPNSASTPFGIRRGSISTNNSDSIDESAVEDDETAKAGVTSPFARRMSFGAQAMRNLRTGPASPGSTGRPSHQSRRISNGNARTPPPVGAPSASTVARRASTSQASNTLPYRTPSDILSARADNGYNWSEQLRSRAESSVQGHRPTVGSHGSPPRGGPHDRSKSVSEMPAPPQQAPAVQPKQPERPKPDHMQERILKGDFYMD
ncbi:hypothetical protein F4819DRAFT_497508 [Hypoxylon fuscum]|nr:hypothetical protein F4819DRAFT_497508 [Hypoxylon fuscum]